MTVGGEAEAPSPYPRVTPPLKVMNAVILVFSFTLLGSPFMLATRDYQSLTLPYFDDVRVESLRYALAKARRDDDDPSRRASLSYELAPRG